MLFDCVQRLDRIERLQRHRRRAREQRGHQQFRLSAHVRRRQVAEHPLVRPELECRRRHMFWHRIPRCESSAGLGDPVEPVVKMTCAPSLGSTRPSCRVGMPAPKQSSAKLRTPPMHSSAAKMDQVFHAIPRHGRREIRRPHLPRKCQPFRAHRFHAPPQSAGAAANRAAHELRPAGNIRTPGGYVRRGAAATPPARRPCGTPSAPNPPPRPTTRRRSSST